VTSLDLRGDTLFVTTSDGRGYRVDGVDQATFWKILPEGVASVMAKDRSSSLAQSRARAATYSLATASVYGCGTGKKRTISVLARCPNRGRVFWPPRA
jgi:hypothetical protein